MTEKKNIFQEKQIIKRALVCYWGCKVCKALGWFNGCSDKDKCADILYERLKEHFERVK